MTHRVAIRSITPVTHNVNRYRLEKPEGYAFTPGQATDVTIDKDGWRDKKNPFTFTALNDEDELEFTIKSYRDHNGVTNMLAGLKPGDALLIREPWGTIQYKGPGTFIAGGAGVTPFIAILRQLNAKGELAGNRLIASNKTEADIILRDEFEAMQGLETVWTVTGQKQPGVLDERIDRGFLERHVGNFDQNFYLCGPDDMVKDLRQTLQGLGADVDALTWEK
jgi:ferredoxin-NADP reductase